MKAVDGVEKKERAHSFIEVIAGAAQLIQRGALGLQRGRIKLSAPQLPFPSNVSGTWITAAEATDPKYWVRHLRQTVRFADGVGELLHP